MSQQVQYNYYNTLATKINDTTFIFRGKTNVPNLRIQASLPDTGTSDYISTKLTINPSEGTIEIEHEPITNYSKKVIVTIPLHLDIGSDSKEINLNSMIPKSIRFKIDETENAIYLHPDTGGSSYKEGLSTKDQAKIDKKITDMEQRLNTRIVTGDTNLSEIECTPIVDEKGEKITTFTSDNKVERKAQKTWHAIVAAVVSIAFAAITYSGAPLVYLSIITSLNPATATATYSATKVLKREAWILIGMIAIFVLLFLGFIPGKGKDKKKHYEIIGYVILFYFIFIAISLFSIFMYRKEKFIDADAIKITNVDKQTSIYGPVRGFGTWFTAIRT